MKMNEPMARALLNSDENLTVLFDWNNGGAITLKYPAHKKELAESIADVLNHGKYYLEVYQLMKKWVNLHRKRSVNGAVIEAEFIVVDARLHNEYKVKPELTPTNYKPTIH